MKDVKFRFVNRIKQTGEIRFVYSSINELEAEDGWQGSVNYERLDINLFTGLLDKNGKEIYEGDILKYFQPFAERWDTHIVKWDNDWACFGLFEEGNEWCKENDWVKIREIEVIGNKFDNPELLK